MTTQDSQSHDTPGIVAVDALDVQVLVDNVTDPLSTNPDTVQSELARLLHAGMTVWSGEAICCPHHGLSLVLTARAGSSEHTILFDAGPEGYAVERNGSRLGISFGAIETVVLSHGHWDHGGGLLKALDLIRAQNHRIEIPLYMHEAMFRSRGLRMPGGEVVPFKDLPSMTVLSAHGAAVVCTGKSQRLLDDFFHLSGEIPRVTPYEQGLPNHVWRTSENEAWQPDPWIVDERFLAVRVRDKGLVVFTACSHAGVVNVLTHAREAFPNVPIYAVMGGFHLSGPGPEKIIPETMRDLASFGLQMIIPGHCTGWRAVTALVNRFGENVVQPSAVGKRYTF
jgi:7,8-dihydropterin-6-yl-methyl-4-(beta-D-ribofuranosyl)aminobenzene 5'-phosphate synthase